jgi:D-lactate dehydrogenase (cytochrome)
MPVMITKENQEDIIEYISDASNMKGHADKVYLPESYSELQFAIKECYANDIPVCISASRTGLTGACVPLSGSLISVQRMNRIINIDEVRKIVTVEPAVTLAELDDALSEKGFFYPPNPTERDSSIGGNVNTNASGSRTFKYGPTRDYVQSLKIILADGTELQIDRGQYLTKDGILEIKSKDDQTLFSLPIVDIDMPKIKNASGYYLKDETDAIDLFIGSEGTLGVVAEIGLKFIDQPEKLLGGIVWFDDFEKMLDFADELRSISQRRNQINYREIDKICARITEYFDHNSLIWLKENDSRIPNDAIAALWFEQEYLEIHEDNILNDWLRFIGKYTNLSDETRIALNREEHNKLRDFRHALPLKVFERMRENKQLKISTDSAVPEEHFNDFCRYIHQQSAASGFHYVVYGHIANCHLHANFFVTTPSDRDRALEIYDKLIDKALEYGGTVSAEHGIGKLKKKYLLQMYGKEKLEYMKSIKRILDPKNILGQSTMFD